MINIVNDWRPAGEIILWTSKKQNRNYFGWHVRADSIGCLSVIDLIDRMAATSYPTYRTIPLKRPPNFSFEEMCRKSDLVLAEKLKFSFDPSLPADTWEAIYFEGAFKLTVGSKFLSLLRTGFSDINRGEGDYSIGPGRHERRPEDRLWFW